MRFNSIFDILCVVGLQRRNGLQTIVRAAILKFFSA